MAALAVQAIAITGHVPTYVAAAAGGDTLDNASGTNWLHVKNGGGASMTVTTDSVTACSYGFDHDVVNTIAAGAERMIGPFGRDRYTSVVSFTYSAVTSVTVAALRLP